MKAKAAKAGRIQYLNMKYFNTKILYYLSIHDVRSLLMVTDDADPSRVLKLYEIFNFDEIMKAFEWTEITSQKFVYFLHRTFKFYDINYAYKRNDDSSLSLTRECEDIKKVYGCKNLSEAIKYAI